MTIQKARLIIQDMSWEKCVSRVEASLRGLSGVREVNVKLRDGNVGEAEIFYGAGEITMNALDRTVTAASGPKHNFTVLSVESTQYSETKLIT